MSRALTKKEAQAQQLQQHAQQQQLQQQGQYARDVETREHHAKAEASAGLNLNIFGALSGAFSSKSKKTTHTNADGSSDSVEDRYEQGAANGYAQGHGTAYAHGTSDENFKHQKSREIGQSAAQTKKIEASKTKKQVDHLGIEG